MCAAILNRLSAHFIFLCTLFILTNMAVLAAETPAPTSNALDGMKFVGETGEKGKKANNPDTISFEGGVFRSSSCEALGFNPGTYSVEKRGENYHFSATLLSPDTGTLEFSGTIIGNTANAIFRWRHTRWYVWKIDRSYWYKGTRPSSHQ